MTVALPGNRYRHDNSGGDNIDPLLSEQKVALEALETLLKASADTPVIQVPSTWLRHLLRAAKTKGLAGVVPCRAEDAAVITGLSPSRVKRLAGKGLAPGAYREPGPKGEWRFTPASLEKLMENRRRGYHREQATA